MLCAIIASAGEGGATMTPSFILLLSFMFAGAIFLGIGTAHKTN